MPPLDLHIEGQNVEVLPEWRSKIEQEMNRLQNHYFQPILHARATIIGTRHHHLGTFEVHLAVTVEGDTITIIRQGEFIPPLLVEAFDVLDRRLLERSSILQRETKAHEEHFLTGKVARFFPEDEYGFILADDGSEVYFHVHAVKKGKAGDLKPGTLVKFGPEEGEKGPQAAWVRVLGH